MKTHTKTGLAVLRYAAIAAVIVDILMQGQSWGINVCLSVLICVIASEAISRATKIERTTAGRVLPWLLPIFAAGTAWRASFTLFALDLFAIAIVGTVAVLRGQEGSLLFARVTEYPIGLAKVGFQSLVGVLPLAKLDIDWGAVPVNDASRRTGTVVRGVLIGLPLLLVFGSLFVQADAEFRQLAGKLFDWDLSDVLSHVVWTAFFFALIAGCLRSLLIADWAKPERAGSQAWKLGAGEVVVTLGMLNALFLAFVAVQVRFLFGGANSVHTVAGMTYTTYARSGFFELLWVTGLVLPVLLGLDWLKSDTNAAQIRLFRALSASLIVLLFVIMASAVQRLNLYIAQFGLTELRLYSSIFMGWLAVVFCWFVATVLTGRRERFVFGALVSGLAVIVGMHIANPAAVIVRTNIARIAAGHPVDIAIFTELGADAVPALVSGIGQIKSPTQRSDIANYLTETWRDRPSNDWPSWTYAEYAARSAVASEQKQLTRMIVAPPPPEPWG